MTRCAIKGPGVCAGLATANSMHCMAEALGMTLPGNAPIRAASPEMMAYAQAAGARIVEMIAEDLRPRAILTPGAFRNAVRTAVAIGCSVNTVRHLTAIAAEAECDVDVLAEFEAATDVPQITQVRPNGPTRIETFAEAGGVSGAMKQLASQLDLTVMTASGKRLGEVLAARPEPDSEVIRPLDNPFRTEPGLTIAKGSLAPIGSVVKLSAVPKHVRRFEGTAIVYEDESQAIAAIESGAIQPGHAVVLRMLGPKGGPGTVFAASFMAALVGAGLGDKVAVITDGELSGLNSGITIGQVMPEAAEGGPLAAVETGDPIKIDLEARTIDLAIPAAEIEARLAALPPRPPTLERGWLAMYRVLVQPMSKGAVLRATR
jgi:dihydroxy-acid dehydratase